MTNRILVLAATVAFFTSSCMWIRTGEQPTGPTVNEQGFSLLTEAGIAQIKRTKHARFDLRSTQLTKTAVGLQNSSYSPMIGHAGGGEMTFTFLGPTAREEVITENITFVTSSITNTVETIVWFSAPKDIAAAHTELRAGVNRWGFRNQDVERWITNSAKREQDKESLGMGIGPTGLVVDVTARKKNGNEIYQYGIHLDPRYYTPETQQTIRETGKSIRWPPTTTTGPPPR
ncbi:Uncharacterised protein [Mycobacteroides abscessus subsp. abscessus]|uniref:hypothetical protein n=1 Tax=Mycobacteroides abscessus TaxID=36809 RepID=UPI000926BDC1|nr:hypothetical protein [Mycobacteroides abscessus]SIH39229.1 Uncharacterised protein [Mycobacteroides abscessus subsp. abscessus]